MTPKLTKWFDGSKFVPAHVGVYKTNIFNYSKTYQYWDGLRWHCYNRYIRHPQMANIPSGYQNMNWRGLAVKP